MYIRRRSCFSVGEGYQTTQMVPCGTSLNVHMSESGPEIIRRLSYRRPSRCVSPFPGSRAFTPSTMYQYPHSCPARGPTVTDQTPLSSLVILISLAPSQLPFNATSEALGAESRNVTVLSGWISGERGGRTAPAPLPGANCTANLAAPRAAVAGVDRYLARARFTASPPPPARGTGRGALRVRL